MMFFARMLMESLLTSCLLVFTGEIGDKTQLLTLILFLRYKNATLVLTAILVATLLNHALAAAAGVWIGTELIPESWQKVVLATVFILGAIWVLIPDKIDEDSSLNPKMGPWLTCFIAFFIAEMGDKTQLLTVALAAQYQSTFAVTAGTTIGMMGANCLAIVFGKKWLTQIPMIWVRRVAAIFFCIMAALIYLRP